MSSKECVFCEPGHFADKLIATNELATAFLSTPRLTPGHTLVIPKRHVELPSELTSDETGAIFDLIGPIHAKLLGSIAVGVDIWQKTRPEVAQDGHKVDHVHFHILPSTPGEELYGEALNWRRPNFAPLGDNERLQMLGLLQSENQ